MSREIERRMDNAALSVGDSRDTAEMAASLVMKGDISGLSPEARARYYLATCEQLGLNPNAQPFAFLRLNGKELMYPTRGATDQLAAIHRVTREIIDGPKVIDLAGTKLVYAVCRATLPNGRSETATATVPLADPAMVLMKCETKSKRRATLAILGLAMLDETEVESIPAERVEVVRRALGAPPVEESPHDDVGPVVTELASFEADLAECSTLTDVAACWQVHSARLAEEGSTGDADVMVAAWLDYHGHHLAKTERQLLQARALADVSLWLDRVAASDAAGIVALVREGVPGDRRTQPIAKLAAARRWGTLQTPPITDTKRAAQALGAALKPTTPPDDGPRGGRPQSDAPAADAQGEGVDLGRELGAPQALAAVPAWAATEAGIAGYVASKDHPVALENAVRAHGRIAGAHFLALAAERLEALTPADEHGARATPAALYATVRRWADEGPRTRREPAPKRGARAA